MFETRLDNWTFSEAEQVQDAERTVYRVVGTERGVGEYHGMRVNHLGWPAGSVTGVGATERDALIDAVRQDELRMYGQQMAMRGPNPW